MFAAATEVKKLAAMLETVGETDAGVEDLAGLSEADRTSIAEALEKLPDPDRAAGASTVKAPSIFQMYFWF